MENIKISPEDKMKNIIFSEINENDYKVFLFGSRATGKYRPNSDYDIGIKGNERLEYPTYLRLKRKLNELPYLIDLIDFNTVGDDFNILATKKIILWN